MGRYKVLLFVIANTLIKQLDASAQLPPPTSIDEEIKVPDIRKEIKIPIDQEPIQLDTPEVIMPPVRVREILFIDNKIFSDKVLLNLVSNFLDKDLSIQDFNEITRLITKFYIEKGYVSSGAEILVPDNPLLSSKDAVLKVRIIEGKIRNINIDGSKPLEGYVRNRLKQNKAFNYKTFINRLLILQDDPLIKGISGNFSRTQDINISDINLAVEPAYPYNVSLFTNNQRNPGTGSFERGLSFTALNPLMLGDKLELVYRNTDGSNAISTSYSVPINRYDTKIAATILFGENNTIERPFNNFGLRGETSIYKLEIQHPVLRYSTAKELSRFDLSLSLEHLVNQDRLFGFDFPILRGSDDSGRIQSTVIRLGQKWTFQDTMQSVIISSSFNLGIDLFSITDPFFDNGEFFSWSSQALWRRQLPLNLQFISKFSMQFSDRPLISPEQCTLGGSNSIRGYRQDSGLGDNCIFGSLELLIPIYSRKNERLSVSPFFDIGSVWNNNSNESSSLLTSVGLSVNYNLSDRLNANITWGIPLSGQFSDRKSLQDNGVTMSLNWRIL